MIYKNNNIVGIKNNSSFNDGLEYFNYDNNVNAIVYSDNVGVMIDGEFIYQLILNLSFSKNNYKRLKFNFKAEDQSISFEYDQNNRPVKRTVINNYDGQNRFKYEQLYEYLD